MYGWAGGHCDCCSCIKYASIITVPNSLHQSYFHLFSLIIGLDCELSVTRTAFINSMFAAPNALPNGKNKESS